MRKLLTILGRDMEKTICSEIWKPVEGWEDYYEVSNKGRVRSKARRMHNYLKPGRVLKPQNNGHSYYSVGLHAPVKKDKHAYIYIMVAKAFIPNPNNLSQVNHIDFNKANNCVENLEWVTPQENVHHFRFSERYAKYDENRQKRLSSKVLQRVMNYKKQIIKMFEEGQSIDEIRIELNVGRDFVADVLKLFDKL